MSTDWIKHTNAMHWDSQIGGASTSGRLIFDDPCTASALPSGATSAGTLTFDSTRLRRDLGGASSSSYISPSFPLNGAVILEVVHENTGAYTAGSFEVKLIRDSDSAVLANAAYQSDGNMVANIDGASRSASGTTTAATTYVRDDTGNMHRTTVSVHESKVVHCALGQNPGGGAYGPLSENSGRRGQAGARFAYTGTLSAGDDVHFTLTTGTTRVVGIYLIRIWRGAIAP